MFRSQSSHTALLATTDGPRASSLVVWAVEHPRPPVARPTMTTTIREASTTSRTVRHEAGTLLQAAPTAKNAAAQTNVMKAQVTA